MSKATIIHVKFHNSPCPNYYVCSVCSYVKWTICTLITRISNLYISHMPVSRYSSRRLQYFIWWARAHIPPITICHKTYSYVFDYSRASASLPIYVLFLLFSLLCCMLDFLDVSLSRLCQFLPILVLDFSYK
jgi:hypothetical protein